MRESYSVYLGDREVVKIDARGEFPRLERWAVNETEVRYKAAVGYICMYMPIPVEADCP